VTGSEASITVTRRRRLSNVSQHLEPSTVLLQVSELSVTPVSFRWGTPDVFSIINPLTPKDPYSGRTAPLTSKRCILCIYSTNTGIEYFKHGIYYPFFSLQNAVCFIILTYLVPVLFTLYIQSVLKFKKIILASKG